MGLVSRVVFSIYSAHSTMRPAVGMIAEWVSEGWEGAERETHTSSLSSASCRRGWWRLEEVRGQEDFAGRRAHGDSEHTQDSVEGIVS